MVRRRVAGSLRGGAKLVSAIFHLADILLLGTIFDIGGSYIAIRHVNLGVALAMAEPLPPSSIGRFNNRSRRPTRDKRRCGSIALFAKQHLTASRNIELFKRDWVKIGFDPITLGRCAIDFVAAAIDL